MAKARKRRFHFVVDEAVRASIEELRAEMGLKSLTEYVSRALAVYDWLWEQKKAGAKILIKKDDGECEFVFAGCPLAEEEE